MDYKVIYTNKFNHFLRGLLQQGQKKVVQAVRAAFAEAGMTGEILTLPRTKHGETRIQNVEKYDLSDGYRLVIQLVDGKKKVRAFLFVGSHDDSDRWLDSHRNYRWIKNDTDGTLEFVQVSEGKEQHYIPADRMDLESPEDMLELPLLRVLSLDEWACLKLTSEAQNLAAAVSGNHYERDGEGALEQLAELAGWEKATLVLDLWHHAHAHEHSQLHQRINLLTEEATLATPEEVAPAMLAPQNSESFVTFDDADEFANFFDNHSMADWLLFLHPEQKRVSEKDFRGPARLRGVSGSGKTSVLVHRARFLAKKYQLRVLLVTLTESMRKLLEHLADDLCGVERGLINGMTMGSLARQVVHELHPQSSGFYTLISQQHFDALIAAAAHYVRSHSDFARTPLNAMDDHVLVDFLRDEITYVRGGLRPEELNSYLDSHLFPRRGRGLALNETARSVVLDAIRFYEAKLKENSLLDHEGIVAEALTLLDSDRCRFNKQRCVLCDEVQDLSQLEVALLGRLPTPDGEPAATAENGLFLTGDGAQSIYKRGFTLRRLGIDISGRSFTLRKNYRNTHEILTAAFGLVSQFEFADVDEENIAKPTEPEFAKRHGSRPMIVRCSSVTEEATVIAERVSADLAYGLTAGQICIVGPNVRIREEVQRALVQIGVPFTDLKQDADYESDRVKVSTIESAKGHEFSAVYVAGLVEGVLPRGGITEAEIPREAARLYVAMTRARDTLTLTYSPSGTSSASRFLLAILPHCDEARIRDKQVHRVPAS